MVPWGFVMFVDPSLPERLRSLASHARGRMQADLLTAADLAEAASKPKKVSVKRGAAEAFFDALQIARKAIEEAEGTSWAIRGLGVWASLPTGLRSFKGPRGGTIRSRRDMRVPPAEYWPDGKIPAALTLAQPSNGPRTRVDAEHPMLVRLRAAMAEQIEKDRRFNLIKSQQKFHANAVRHHLFSEAADIRRNLAKDLKHLRMSNVTTDIQLAEAAD